MYSYRHVRRNVKGGQPIIAARRCFERLRGAKWRLRKANSLFRHPQRMCPRRAAGHRGESEINEVVKVLESPLCRVVGSNVWQFRFALHVVTGGEGRFDDSD